MNDQIWSWLLSIVGVAGFILAGRKIWWAWYINIFCQGLWLAYAVSSEQWGFLFGGVIYTVVFVNNAWKWTAEHKRNATTPKQDRVVTITVDSTQFQDVGERVKAELANLGKKLR